MTARPVEKPFVAQTRLPKSRASLVIWWHPLRKNLKSQKLENAIFSIFFIRYTFSKINLVQLGIIFLSIFSSIYFLKKKLSYNKRKS